ncbi:MAG: GNAT family N-acetyltransferase, partial [Actinobacteria bacterium]|nr:GNAT family N-acetyltransferase [Actinomycetota bacterium]MCL6094519.1 GNAT family N-acetyltransferase [Actinomycetota bacterium]
GVKLKEVYGGSDNALLLRLYEEVFLGSFPEDELGPPWWDPSSEMDTTTIDTRTWTLVALDDADEVLGGLVTEWFPASEVLLLSYLAVSKDHRGQGVGSYLLKTATERHYGHPGYQLVLGELEDPRHWSAAGQDPLARLQFYKPFGVLVLTIPYFQPPVAPGRPPAYHMLLASFDPVAPGILPGPVADGMRVRKFIEEYLHETSMATSATEVMVPDATWLLSYYDGQDIPLIPLLDYRAVPDPDPPGYTPGLSTVEATVDQSTGKEGREPHSNSSDSSR